MENTNDNKRMQDANQISGRESAPEQPPEQTSRRAFLRRVGAAVFSALIVDATAEHAAACPPCGNGTTDIFCYAVPGEGLYDPDANCGVGGDTDQSCVSGIYQVTDENCGKGANHSDTDAGCTSTSTSDANCYIGGTNQHDVDATCKAESNHTDNACGDCNDSHDSDQHCDVSGDTDNMCGHQHWNAWPIDTDDTCANHIGESDVGCGWHDNGYLGGGGTRDYDDNCYVTIETPDQNCWNLTSDEYCATQQYTTTPDESCTSTSSDEACMNEFDSDQHCNNTNDSDQHCAKGNITDEDNHCGIGGDTDESCTEYTDVYGIPHGSPDEATP